MALPGTVTFRTQYPAKSHRIAETEPSDAALQQDNEWLKYKSSMDPGAPEVGIVLQKIYSAEMFCWLAKSAEQIINLNKCSVNL